MDLQPGGRVIDIGCGPATDTIEFAEEVGPDGQVVGIDLDPGMVAIANTRAMDSGVDGWTNHLVGAASPLPYPADAFDSWHAERVLQHMPEIAVHTALMEAQRVVRSGGRVVVVDTDWGTLAVSSGPVGAERRLVRLVGQRMANGYVGRHLPRLLRRAGLVVEVVEPYAVSLGQDSFAYVMLPTVRHALAAGYVTPVEVRVWEQNLLDFAATGDFLAVVTMFVLVARSP